VLRQISAELRKIANAIGTGAPILPVPEIPLPPRPAHSALPERDDLEFLYDDDIPF
jgi:hypothetical protein